MHKRLLISPLGLGLAAVLCGLALPSALQAQPVGSGFNGFDTVTTGPSVTMFDGLPWAGVALGTFDFGFGPVNVGQTDTIIQRLGTPVTVPGGTIGLAVDALQLQTVNQVSFGGGPVGYYFLTLNTSVPNQNSGQLTIDSFPTAGLPGTFHDYFTVYFDVRFGSLTGPIVAPDQNLTLTASGDWLPTLPIPSIPIDHVYPNPENPTDLHVVTLDPDPDIPNDGFYPFGVPEPSGLALLGCGALCLAIKTRRGRKQTA